MRIRLGVDVVVYFVSPIFGASKFVSQLSSSYWTLVNIHQLDFISSLPFWMNPAEIILSNIPSYTTDVQQFVKDFCSGEFNFLWFNIYY